MPSIPRAPASASLEIKRSEFIALAAHADSAGAARAFIGSVREQYPDARHVCWAYIAGENGVTTELSASDDGEPSGTAGKPMLNVLQHSGVSEIVVAVVRYFGGIKLGTGGLVRAYSDAVQAVLEVLELHELVPSHIVNCELDYELEAQLRHVLSTMDSDIEDVAYADKVTLRLRIAESDYPEFVRLMGHRLAIELLDA